MAGGGSIKETCTDCEGSTFVLWKIQKTTNDTKHPLAVHRGHIHTFQKYPF